MDERDIKRRLDAVKCFLLDMDGTFYLGGRILPGSLRFLEALKAGGRQALFLTNNSSRTGQYYMDKLKRMGVGPPFLRVLTSAHAAARYIREKHPGQKGFLLGNASVREELSALGLTWDQEAPDYVLIAYDTSLDYLKMTHVCDWVRGGLPYIATHPDFNCPTEHGFAPDIGAIIAFIEASTGRKPDIILGKPYRGIVEEALKITGLQPDDLAMTGDRLYTDILTGLNFGMTSILVLTGETSPADAAKSETKPDLIFERLSDMIPYL
jgi:HAD superfamily hydrolase (TIGR01450 family)